MALPDPAEAARNLEVARRHLEHVLTAWDAPTDWDSPSVFGFYCVEAAVMAAAAHLGIETKRTHWGKADTAEVLAREHGLPDLTDLLDHLDDARKAVAYGDVEVPDLDAEEVASAIEGFVEEVSDLLSTGR